MQLTARKRLVSEICVEWCVIYSSLTDTASAECYLLSVFSFSTTRHLCLNNVL